MVNALLLKQLVLLPIWVSAPHAPSYAVTYVDVVPESKVSVSLITKSPFAGAVKLYQTSLPVVPQPSVLSVALAVVPEIALSQEKSVDAVIGMALAQSSFAGGGGFS